MIRFNAANIAKKYLGIPYKHKGRDITGLDCWGFIVCVYQDYGIQLFDLEDYDREWSRRGGDIILGNHYENWKRVFSYQLGDVVLINYPRENVGHAGIYLERGKFIHCSREGVVVSRIKDWERKIYGYYRWTRVKAKT